MYIDIQIYPYLYYVYIYIHIYNVRILNLYTLEYLQKHKYNTFILIFLYSWKSYLKSLRQKIGKGIYVLMHVLFYLVIDIIDFLFPASITDGDDAL